MTYVSGLFLTRCSNNRDSIRDISIDKERVVIVRILLSVINNNGNSRNDKNNNYDYN